MKGDPPEYARILELCLADYSLREIAAQLKVSKSTVETIQNILKARLQRGRYKLVRE